MTANTSVLWSRSRPARVVLWRETGLLGGTMDAQIEATIRLAEWHAVGGWLDYAACEFVADQTTRGYLEHVAQSVREEGERRHSDRAGLSLA